LALLPYLHSWISVKIHLELRPQVALTLVYCTEG